jgi:hypothetical protein
MPTPDVPRSQADPASPASTSLEARLRAGGAIEVRDGGSGKPRRLAPDDPDYDRILAELISNGAGLDEFRPVPDRAGPPARPVSASDSVGVATMQDDGTLELRLRSEDHGAIAEAMLVIPRGDARYASMLAHLGPLAPGGSCAIKPFPA